MRNLLFDGPGSLSLLAVGAHADDIEIGCGATLIRLLRENPTSSIHWVVVSALGVREEEAQRSACAYVDGHPNSRVTVLKHRDGFFPYEGYAIKERFEALKNEVKPDVVFTHHREDRHQDHRLVSELTWNSFRDALIFEYEVAKWDGDLVTPNAYVGADRADAEAKIERLNRFFPSQHNHDWFTDDTFFALMRLRGVESRTPSGLAEGFHARKLVLNPITGAGLE
jgi:LmbE family N-acetylglucosaminyl deacetylase